MLLSAARRLKSRIDEGVDTFVAFNQCQDHLVALGNAHIEAHVYDCFESGIARAPDDEIRRALTAMRELFGLSAIERDRGWFLENGVLEGNKAKAIRQIVNALTAESAEMAECLVDGFGIPDACLGAPIAFSIDPRSSPATG